MSELFLKIVNMSVSASWIILAVLGLRLVLKKTPKWVNVLLWGFVAVRLLFPFSMESALSLIPSAETIPEAVLSGSSFEIQTGIAPVDDGVNNYFEGINSEGVPIPLSNVLNVITVLCVVWLIGMLLLAAYTMISCWRFQRKVDTAVLLRENIFQCETVVSPCVLGIIQPKIYLPFKMDAQKLEHVIAHEQAHIRRGDHWWKPLGFFLLTVHWFNPFVWLAYVLLCRDIELACDEKVIKELDSEARADYTQALVACSMSRCTVAACPLAFGEVGVKARVKSIMNYKKPALWINILVAISCAVMAVCFLTNPVKATGGLLPGGSYLDSCAEGATKLTEEATNTTEEATKAPIDPVDEKTNEQIDAERLASMEAERNALKEELARIQAEYEEMIREERYE